MEYRPICTAFFNHPLYTLSIAGRVAKKRYVFIAFMKIRWVLSDFLYSSATPKTVRNRLTVCLIADVFVATTEDKLGRVLMEEDNAADRCVDIGCVLDE